MGVVTVVSAVVDEFVDCVIFYYLIELLHTDYSAYHIVLLEITVISLSVLTFSSESRMMVSVATRKVILLFSTYFISFRTL